MSTSHQAQVRPAYSAVAVCCFAFGIAGLFCPVLGILCYVAIGLGLLELQNIKKGHSSPINRNFARVGLICGAVGGLFQVVVGSWLLFEGAKGVFQFLENAPRSKWF